MPKRVKLWCGGLQLALGPLSGMKFPVPELVGEGLGLAAGVDEDDGSVGARFWVRIWWIRADMDLPV